MNLPSLLYAALSEPTVEPCDPPTYFYDLQLDRILREILSGHEQYALEPLFYAPLTDVDAIYYRQAIMKDVENVSVHELFRRLSDNFSTVQGHLEQATNSSYPLEHDRLILDAAHLYSTTLRHAVEQLRILSPVSNGLIQLRIALAQYLSSDEFITLEQDAASLLASIDALDFRIIIGSGSINVREGGHENDLAGAVERTFQRFCPTTYPEHSSQSPSYVSLNHIEAKVVENIARLYPQPFFRLKCFADRHRSFLPTSVLRLTRELHYYLACTDFARRLSSAGLPTCFPTVSASHTPIAVKEGYDTALACQAMHEPFAIVRNDWFLSGEERMFVVSGPNQGGKTTFARTFGQVHFLAALGGRVAGAEARTFLFDAIFTHFEREELPGSSRGKLEDDLIRIHDILGKATSRSVIILNELFASTTAKDAALLGTRILTRILDLDAIGVCVTFIDELSTLSNKTVSVVSLVDPAHSNKRTLRLARKPADGLAYALALAQTYELTYDLLSARLAARSTS
ncbi:MAG: DNA mismatch repair protein MutS [Candidatus Eremiobacteraeota bacterium]|nr:DNA mismatch repair protein MutS [Candidatus Eremiobacteraeota bacterium]